MNKLILLLMILTVFCMLNATTLEVSLDGTHQYTTIQSAIDASSDGDTVLAHPGRYFENIDFIGKSITVCSEYMNNPDLSIVENTIIDGDQESSCVIVISGEQNAVLEGFTISNGIGYGNQFYRYGGGIFIWEASSLTVLNCIIENNSSITSGGILCSGESTLSLSGNIIRNNKSTYQGGGIGVRDGTVIFDPVNLNSIYNNYGAVQDIFIYDTNCSEIILDTLSIAVTQPDGYFVSYYSEDDLPVPQISAQNSYFTQLNSDLYISTDGDDNNDGLTPETALSTIAFANRLIQPNSLNPNSVLILPGTYSTELNNQFFPIAVQSNTKMLGAGETPEDVILGFERGNVKIVVSNANNTEVGNFTLTQADENFESILLASRSSNLYFHDIICTDNNADFPGLHLLFCDNSIFEKIIISNIANENDRLFCVRSYECNEIALNGIIVDSIVNTMQDVISIYVNLEKSSVSLNNMIISNTIIEDTGLIFQYGNSMESEITGNLELNNFLVYNNTSLSSNVRMINFSSYHDESFINNMTIAHNTSQAAITRFGGDYTIRNSIIYNPQAGYEMGIWVPANGDPFPLWSNVDIDYSLVRNGLSGVAGASNPNNNVIWGSHNIDADPMFRGDVVGDVPVGDYRWLQLSQNSPCVNAGTPDTLGLNLPTVDIGGNPRIWDGIIDMGAWEYDPVPNDEETVPRPPSKIVVSHFPNPVQLSSDRSGCAFIEFTLPKKPIEKPTLEIYNIRGQKVRSIKITQSFSQLVRSAGLSSEDKQSGEKYSQVWDCKDDNRRLVPSGIYFYKVSSDGENAIGKMMVIK